MRHGNILARFLTPAWLALLLSLAVPSLSGPAWAEVPPTDLPSLIPRLLPQVVNISFVKHQSADSKLQAVQAEARAITPVGSGVGTGFVIDALGIICTNRHVTDGGDEIYVTLSDNTRLPAELIYRSPDIDLSLLRVHTPKPLTPITFGDSDTMVQGTQVIAIGNPLGLGGTVTSGIVSARDRDIHETALDSFMQIDASINPGNSGGPLFNLQGQVVGMNTAFFSVGKGPSGSIGLNFAIPGNDVKLVVDMLQKYGRVRKGVLGAQTQDVSPDLAAAVGLPATTGAIISAVDPSGPALAAGLRAGDVLLQMGDTPITSARTARRFVTVNPGAHGIQVALLRDSGRITVPLDIGEVTVGAEKVDMAMQRMTPIRITEKEVGVDLAPLTDDLRTRFKIAAFVKGLVITEVTKGGLGAYLGVEPGDVMLQAAGKELQTREDLIHAAEAARALNRSELPVLVSNADGPRWIAVPIAR